MDVPVTVFGPFELDPTRQRLRKAGRVVRLQPKPLALLAVFVSRPGQTITREELQATLWPQDTHVEFEMGLNTAVRKVRRALGDSARQPRYIQTVPGVGYRFIGAARHLPYIERAPIVRLPPTAQPVSPRRLAARSNRMAAFAAIFLVVVTMRPASRSDPGWVALDQAREAFSSGTPTDARYERARATAEDVLASNPGSWAAHAALAYVRAGHDSRPERAAESFAAAVAAGASDPRVLTDYACVLKELHRFDDALSTIEHGLRRSPRSAVLMAHRGLLLHAVGRYEEEMAALHTAVALDPSSAEAHFHLGLGYARRRQFHDSLLALNSAVALSNDNPQFLSWLGRIAADAGRRAEAEEVLYKLRRQAATAPMPAMLIDAVSYHLSMSQS